ncbi:MAG: N-formylglutamate deformylase [Enterobacterales bacterium]|jgi:N-formylglutamate deformylase
MNDSFEYNSFEYNRGTTPLLISMPHNSSLIPASTAHNMTEDAQLSKDTDWFIDRLYDFAPSMGVHIIKPKYSRYYIDLNRDPTGKDLYPGADNTELCPTTDFCKQALYLEGKNPQQAEITKRIDTVWSPYHQSIKQTLDNIVRQHGYAILFDAHSIASKVPRFFKGSLPDFNFGNADGKSCSVSMIECIEKLSFQPWSSVINGRFKGGYITRENGDPDNDIHAIQLELSQATYLDETTLEWDVVKSETVKIQLQKLIQCLLDWKNN